MRATFFSINMMANRKTRIVHFLLMPIINMLFLMAINNVFTDTFSWNIAVSSILMSGAMMAMNGFCTSFTLDRNLGIDREMAARAPYSGYYWGCKVIISASLAFFVITINLLILVAVGGNRVPWALALQLSPQIIFSGIVLGFVSSVCAWSLKNPYLWLNFLAAFGTVLSGAVVMISAYPDWLKLFGNLFPFAHTLSVLHGAPLLLLHDFWIALGWLFVGVVAYGIQLKQVRTRARFSTL